MLIWLSAMLALHWGSVVGLVGLSVAVLLMAHQQRIYAGERRRDKRIREEFEAYAHLDAGVRSGDDLRELAKRVARLVAKKSAFNRVAMLIHDSDGRLYVAGSIGMEETTVRALQEWGERVLHKENTHMQNTGEQNAGKGEPGNDGAGIRVGEKGFAVVLGKESAEVGCGRAIILPLWTGAGRMEGALAVCADRLMTMQRRAVEEAISPLEALAVKLGRAMEEADIARAERQSRVEKSAGLELLLSEITNALNTPLTAVLGFAELIAETTNEIRVRADAEMISQQGRRMQEIMQNLVNSGRPGAQIEQLDEPVEVASLVRELAAECGEKLDTRGVRLIVDTQADVPAVRGSCDRLRQVLEHLLNNAAQAIAASASEDTAREREIRVSVSRDAGAVQVIVSDTGTGFKEPGRVFDAACAVGQAGAAGLSVCRGIVREHGGEISAFNLHPYGAAVVVELPVREHLAQDFSAAAREVA